ncbi:MAG: glycerol-3-phosphate 1-O-acyltransferase PlsY [Pseudomonadales bacterium]|nr:glycerol-3-phosphate 1-O-acyltransferase PlsY [Pseudomonadales bacterium]
MWLLAYLIGSVSTAILVCQLLGLPDPRSQGSLNPGASNVLRLAGKAAAGLTLAGDVGKGVLPVFLAQQLHSSHTVIALCGLFAFLGHCYPVYFDFRGGKGVATAFGVLAMLDWPCAIAVGALWIGIFALTRTSSLASLISWTFAPFAFYFWADSYLNPLLIMVTVLIYRHYPNIFLLAKGNENRFNENCYNQDLEKSKSAKLKSGEHSNS